MTDTRIARSSLLLSELLTPEGVAIPLSSSDKDSIIRELSRLAAGTAGVPESEQAIHRAVVEREAVLSTGIGGGIAIPHGKTNAVERLVLVAGTTSQPVDFEALDGEPVRIVFLLVGPGSAAGLHVKALSRISRILRSEELREGLAEAESPEAFVSLVRRAEGA